MTEVQFMRTTHEDGRFRSFSVEAMQFWREHGAIVGDVLRIEEAITFAEIVVASREHAFEYPESERYLALDEPYIAWCLIRLLEFGMAELVLVSDCKRLPRRSI